MGTVPLIPLHALTVFTFLHAQLVSRLLALGVDAQLQDVAHGWDALHWGAAGGHADVLRVLLDAGVSPTVADKRGRLALHRSAFDSSTYLGLV